MASTEPGAILKMAAAHMSNTNSTPRNQIGPLSQGPTVIVFHQKAKKPAPGPALRSSTA